MSVSPEAIAAYGLPTAHRLPPSPIEDLQVSTLLAGCESHRVLGLLGSAVRDGAFPVTSAQHEEIEGRWQAWLAHAVRVERLLLDVVAVLTQAGVRSLVLKGVALAHAAYLDPGARVFGDVDLLVEPGRLHRAAAVVATRFEGERAEPEVRPGFDDRFGREVLVRVDPIEVDLHRTFVNGAFGMRIDLEGLFAAPSQVRIGGQDLDVLAPVERLLHAAYATVLSDWPPRLVAARDLAQIVLGSEPDVRAVVDRAHAWRGEAVLAAGIQHAWRVLRITARVPLWDWAQTHPGSRVDRALIGASRGPARGYTSQLTSLLAIRGIRPRAEFLRAIAFPSPEYRAARDLGRLGLVGAGARRARRG